MSVTQNISNPNGAITYSRILELMDCAEFEQAAEQALEASRQRSEQAAQVDGEKRAQLLSESDQIAKLAKLLFSASVDPSRLKIRERINSHDKLLADFDRLINEIKNEVHWFVGNFQKANDIAERVMRQPLWRETDPDRILLRLASQHDADYLSSRVHLDMDAYLNFLLSIGITKWRVKKGFYYEYVSFRQGLPEAVQCLERVKKAQAKVRNISDECEKNPCPSVCRFPEDQSIRSEIIRLLSKK